MGRNELPALEDSLQFPWNRSASARDSRQGSIGRGLGFGSSIGGFGTSGGRQSSIPIIGGPTSMDRRASRITSASPLIGRGGPQRYSDLEVPSFDDENELLGGPSTSIAGDDFQLHGPAAGVDTQTAAKSQWLRAALDAQSNNFLEFVKTEVASKAARVDADQADEDELSTGHITTPNSVFFGELLPPSQNTKTVAAQALLHVLALVTKGMLNVGQKEDYGPIEMGLVAGI